MMTQESMRWVPTTFTGNAKDKCNKALVFEPASFAHSNRHHRQAIGCPCLVNRLYPWEEYVC